eukprot:1549251-Rhodomonas_salina.1
MIDCRSGKSKARNYIAFPLLLVLPEPETLILLGFIWVPSRDAAALGRAARVLRVGRQPELQHDGSEEREGKGNAAAQGNPQPLLDGRRLWRVVVEIAKQLHCAPTYPLSMPGTADRAGTRRSGDGVDLRSGSQREGQWSRTQPRAILDAHTPVSTEQG